jgi:hypothetical protein
MKVRRQRLLAVAAVVAAVTAAAPAHAAPDPRDTVDKVVAIAGGAVNDVAREVDRAVGDGGIGGVGGPIGGGGFPPAGFAVTAVNWSKSPAQLSPVFTPPDPNTSHPANWSCTTSTTATTAHASCTPTDPPDPGTSGWSCYDPYVVADVSTPAGPSTESITGTSHCGTSSSTCTATTTAAGVGHCAQWAFPDQPVPFECDADFSRATRLATWNVRCAPIDP